MLVLHSEDDLVVPVEHARILDEAKGDNELVRVWIVPGGAHAAFDILDPRWTYAVYRTFFERWADYGDARPPHGTAPAAAEVVYSPAAAGINTAGART